MIELGVIMDPPSCLKPASDSTFALLLAAQRRGWILHYIPYNDIYLQDGIVFAAMHRIKVFDRSDHFFEMLDPTPIIRPLHTCDMTLFRKDPPFDMTYLAMTYILDQAKKQKHLIINDPSGIREANEKIFASTFSECCPPTLVSSHFSTLKAFLKEYQTVIFKPLEGMAGQSVFRVDINDLNQNVIIEMLTHQGQHPLMAQQFIPAIFTTGDKRILMIEGVAYPHALSRFPQSNDVRANLAAGGTGVKSALTERDKWIVQQIGPTLKAKGLSFVGIDVIGDYLTEINVTSPTGVRQIEHLAQVPLSDIILDAFLERKKASL